MNLHGVTATSKVRLGLLNAVIVLSLVFKEFPPKGMMGTWRCVRAFKTIQLEGAAMKCMKSNW